MMKEDKLGIDVYAPCSPTPFVSSSLELGSERECKLVRQHIPHDDERCKSPQFVIRHFSLGFTRGAAVLGTGNKVTRSARTQHIGDGSPTLGLSPTVGVRLTLRAEGRSWSGGDTNTDIDGRRP